MPFDKLPGAQLNTSPLTNIHWTVAPPRPIFPTYQVVMDALNHLMPALDPVERAKRQLLLESIPLERAKAAAAMRRMPMEEKMYDLQLKEQELKLQQLERTQKEQEDYSKVFHESFGSNDNSSSAPAPSSEEGNTDLAGPDFNQSIGTEVPQDYAT